MTDILPRVLLIEDDDDISSMYVQRFEVEGGFDIRVARNGLEGLAMFQSFKPDVTLLDMMMPIMSGLETLQKLRALPNGGSIKIIALTNMNDPDMVSSIEKLGVAQHIVKANSTPGAIVDAVRQLTL
jgi:CheY-like chemotaxis protein